MVRENCIGCQFDHPSQKQHSCVKPQTDSLAPILYSIALNRVDKHNLRLLFIEAARNLFLDYRFMSFQQSTSELEYYWKEIDWSDLERCSDVPEHMKDAVVAAKMKICLLERRARRE